MHFGIASTICRVYIYTMLVVYKIHFIKSVIVWLEKLPSLGLEGIVSILAYAASTAEFISLIIYLNLTTITHKCFQPTTVSYSSDTETILNLENFLQNKTIYLMNATHLSNHVHSRCSSRQEDQLPRQFQGTSTRLACFCTTRHIAVLIHSSAVRSDHPDRFWSYCTASCTLWMLLRPCLSHLDRTRSKKTTAEVKTS